MNNLIIYHNEDLDGKCSAAIVLRAIGGTLYGAKHGDDPPAVDNGTRVIIVDFSYPMDQMAELKLACGELVWIDHHKSAILAAAEAGFECAGKRDVRFAACELCWEYYHDDPIPYVVRTLGAYDCWRWINATPERQKDVLHLQYGMRTRPFEPGSPVWDDALGDFYADYVNVGKAIVDYQAQLVAVDHLRATRTLWHGHKALIVNSSHSSSHDWMPYIGDCEILVTFTVLADGKKRYSLRSFGPDVSIIAVAHGGGGHAGAAGYVGD